MNDFHKIKIADIICDNRLRNISDPHVEQLVQSISENGLQTPLLIRIDDLGKYQLITGAHRLKALELLKIEEALCKVFKNITETEGRLIEVDENLIRHELNPLDRAVFLAKRKAIYEELNQKNKGGRPTNKSLRKTNETISLVKSAFSDTTAEKLGLSRRIIERAVRIATRIPFDIKERLAEAGIDKEGELYTLTKYTAQDQKKLIDFIINDKMKNLSAAIDALNGVIKKDDNYDHILNKLVTIFVRAKSSTQKDFVTFVKNHVQEMGE